MKIIETGTGTALVPVEQAVRNQQPFCGRPKPDASFVAQLIATAAGESQTRLLRRATPADAQKDYGRVSARSMGSSRPNGVRVSLVA